ncbi:BAR-domain-containing protein [Polychaeton citri CBS 116435]|uniref:BAR-domain-containing protein n=1 Tax=Polychaeton citri CBS 116435 TaxID=1314669 RepID=A0A9P4UMS7_9PEZI|nr:BAR-domain-containing protein [Polychaeton citri CBS 116435]
MNIGKKFDRLKQYGKERMGGEIKTDTTNDFKALELEMQLRHEGMERLNRSANTYVQCMARREQGEGKERQIPVAYFGTTMTSHGDDFEVDSEFGQCLLALGKANERIARMQETYSANATSSWLESTERSLVQMKEYQAARKKLDQRRLAFDTASVKMQKTKKEDFRMEEELRNQKAKYEESSEEVYRRMMDIKEAEADSIGDLGSFLDAELAYYDRCREVLVQLKRDWPGTIAQSSRSGAGSPANGMFRSGTPRSRSNTASSFNPIAEDELYEPPHPRFGSRLPSGQSSPRREVPGFDLPVRPIASRANSGFEGPTSLGRDGSPAGFARLGRVPTAPGEIMGARSNLRSASRDSGNVFAAAEDDREDDQSDLSMSRTPTWSTQGHDGTVNTAKKLAPPPPPPSRGKKPPPPPPPFKRSALSESQVSHY